MSASVTCRATQVDVTSSPDRGSDCALARPLGMKLRNTTAETVSIERFLVRVICSVCCCLATVCSLPQTDYESDLPIGWRKRADYVLKVCRPRSGNESIPDFPD